LQKGGECKYDGEGIGCVTPEGNNQSKVWAQTVFVLLPSQSPGNMQVKGAWEGPNSQNSPGWEGASYSGDEDGERGGGGGLTVLISIKKQRKETRGFRHGKDSSFTIKAKNTETVTTKQGARRGK